jgi:hypothetical protein
MGLLDDAIREHLELKRRHGADPSEVERQEHEALGPARRTATASADTAELDEDAPGGDAEDAPVAFYSGEDEDLGYNDEDDAPVASMPAAAPAAPAEHEDRFEHGPADDAAEVVEDLEPVDPADLAPPPPAERVRPAETEAPPERRREPEPEPQAAASEEADGDEDVLEETPEFLQETPEHERLWFEQKPPRDFEF